MDVPLQDRVPTVSERIYREFLCAATEEERAKLEGQLVAICIAACRCKHITPPREQVEESQYENGKARWTGGPYSLPSWVRDWVGGQVSGEPLTDGARYIGRRCVNALIDEIRWHKRRKRGAQIRNRGRWEDDPEHVEFLREVLAQELADIGLPDALRLEGDRNLLKRLLASYPTKPSNVSIAREMGVSEGAVRKRRKRISKVCFELADGKYHLCTTIEQLGLRKDTERKLDGGIDRRKVPIARLLTVVD